MRESSFQARCRGGLKPPAAAVLALTVAAHAWTPEQNFTLELADMLGTPAVAIDAQARVHVVFPARRIDSEQPRLYYKSLIGATWSAAVDLPGPNHKETSPSIDIDGNGILHVAGIYRVDPLPSGDAPYTIFYWSYNGTAWTGPLNISSGTGKDASDPVLLVDRNNDLHIAWKEDGMTGGEKDILYRKRQGGAWQAVKNVTNNNAGTSYGSDSLDMAVDANGNTVHLVWHDDFVNDGFQAYYTKNTNLGDPGAWLPSSQWHQLSTGSYGKSPRVFLDNGNNPNVFWYDRFGGSTNKLGYSRWTGSAWTAAANWGSKTAYGAWFDAANVMHLVYVNMGVPEELWCLTWNYVALSSSELISNGANTFKVDQAALAVNAYNRLYAVWEERKGGPAYNYYSTKSLWTGPSGWVAGTVRDGRGQAVVGATVASLSGEATTTGANGTYTLPVPAGNTQVTASKPVYSSQTLAVNIMTNATTPADFVISTPSPDPVTQFSAVPGNTFIALTWRNPGNTTFAGTMLRYRTDRQPLDPSDGVLLADRPAAPNSTDTFTHAGLINGTQYFYSAFAHDGEPVPNYSQETFVSSVPFGPADYDRDGDVDMDDFGHFQTCLSGSTIPQYNPDCQDAKFDLDSDVDASDLAVFMNCLSGPNALAMPNCAG